MIHELSLERRNLHGHFSRDLEPALTVDSGDSVRFSTPNAAWDLEDGTPFEPGSEISREFAPYVGVSYDRKLGDSARFARIDGERVDATSLVTGIRFWF